MTVSLITTVVLQNATAIARNSFIQSNTTLELLSPLYPTANLSQADVDAIISDLCNELDINWQKEQNPGLLDIIEVEYHDELGSGQRGTRIFTDMTACDNLLAKYPIAFDHRLYTLDGINLVKISDNSVVATLTPKEYARWQWTFYGQVVSVRGVPTVN